MLALDCHVTTVKENKAHFMTAHRTLALLASVSIQLSVCNHVRADDPPPPAITNVYTAGQQLNLQFTFYPSAETYTILSAPDLNSPFLPDPNFLLSPRYLTNYFTNVVNGTNVVTTNWVKIGNITADGNGSMEFIDNDVASFPMRFYRIVLP